MANIKYMYYGSRVYVFLTNSVTVTYVHLDIKFCSLNLYIYNIVWLIMQPLISALTGVQVIALDLPRIYQMLSAKSSLILGENKAAFHRERHHYHDNRRNRLEEIKEEL